MIILLVFFLDVCRADKMTCHKMTDVLSPGVPMLIFNTRKTEGSLVRVFMIKRFVYNFLN